MAGNIVSMGALEHLLDGVGAGTTDDNKVDIMLFGEVEGKDRFDTTDLNTCVDR